MDFKKTLNLPKTKFPMKANLSQREPEMLKRWDEMDLYGMLRRAGKGRPRFILHDGPPYANGHIHLGHTVNKVLKDMIIKHRQMTGMDAPYVPGWDCHGLPIEHNVEKELGKKKRQMDKLAIRKACRKYAEKFVKIQRDEFKRLGVSGDWANPYLTMNYDYEAAIAREFCRIYLDGHVVKSKKPVYWCPSCVTALAEAEVEYAPHRSPSITVKFPADADLLERISKAAGRQFHEGYLLIWTTTPWTLPANRAVAVHPDYTYVAAVVDLSRTGGGKELWIAAESRIMAVLTSLGLDQTDMEITARLTGAELEGLHVRHPFLDRTGPIINADYVTLDTGTGCVHIAPGHGAEDYESGLRYGLEVYSPVDKYGRFRDEIKEFAGMNIFKANPEIIALLDSKGLLVAHEDVEHSYPHCWRCKKPVIFRATAQWFISMDRKGLRQEALKHIEEVEWIPQWGKERIYGMVEARPDWCISRQRSWGVPITVFVCQDCETPIMTEQAAEKIAEIFQKEGADAWFTRPAADFLGEGYSCPKCGGSNIDKENDILDVWFDSGVSHAAVLEQRPELSSPADLYLEGSDQHRGWFQSSLLTSTATRHRAPYRSVLTHGFVVDGQGKKMSKSVGNVIPPEKVIKRFGAEILRLWVSAEDYQDDIKISDEILQRLTEAYRKIRNTIRYLLGNLSDFSPEQDAVPFQDMEPLDRWAVARADQVFDKVIGAYSKYRFHVVFHQLYQFCTVDLSALYLDIIKDRLYCELKGGRERRSAQSAMHTIAQGLIKTMAPVLSFTAEEAWGHLTGTVGQGGSSVFMESMPETGRFCLTQQESDFWDRIWPIRAEITKALELARRQKRIGLALDARVLVELPSDYLKGLDLAGLDVAECLKMITIVSQLEIAEELEGSAAADANLWASEDIDGLKVLVAPARGKKCDRCWTWTEQPQTYGDSTICPRCLRVMKELEEELQEQD